MKKKGILIFALCMLFVFGLSACAGAGRQDASSPQDSPASEDNSGSTGGGSPAASVPGERTEIKEGINVEAVFLGLEKQKVADEEDSEDEEYVDSLWVYYSDNTFEQFVIMDDKTELFSLGTYEFSENGDFIYEKDKDNGSITINRTMKYVPEKGLTEFQSSDTIELGTLGFTQLYAPNEKKIETIFAGPNKQPFGDTEGDDEEEWERIDTWWIYYNDMSFEQFAQVNDDIVLFSTGSYDFDKNGDFRFDDDEEEHGKITINRDQKYIEGEGLTEYESSHTYELKTLGFDQLFVIVK